MIDGRKKEEKTKVLPHKSVFMCCLFSLVIVFCEVLKDLTTLGPKKFFKSNHLRSFDEKSGAKTCDKCLF